MKEPMTGKTTGKTPRKAGHKNVKIAGTQKGKDLASPSGDLTRDGQHPPGNT